MHDDASPFAHGEEPIVSPELALVDPVLGAWARERLPAYPPYPSLPTAFRIVTPGAEDVSDGLSNARGTSDHAVPTIAPAARVLAAASIAVLFAATILLRGAFTHGTATEDAATFHSRSPAARAATRRLAGFTTPAPRVLAWPKVARAVAYRVAFSRGEGRILATTTRASIVFRAGRRERFGPGTYRWTVRPVYRTAKKRERVGKPIVSSKLTIVAP